MSPAGLAVLLGLYAGLRREEIASLRWTDIRDDWLVIVGKGDVTGEIPIHSELAKRLGVARATSSSHFVFPGRLGGHVTPATIWGWCRALSLEALEIPVATHVLRHTAIATLNDKTMDLRAAQHFARHQSPETTVLYTRVNRDRLVNAVAAIDY
jgi:integrase